MKVCVKDWFPKRRCLVVWPYVWIAEPFAAVSAWVDDWRFVGEFGQTLADAPVSTSKKTPVVRSLM